MALYSQRSSCHQPCAPSSDPKPNKRASIYAVQPPRSQTRHRPHGAPVEGTEVTRSHLGAPTRHPRVDCLRCRRRTRAQISGRCERRSTTSRLRLDLGTEERARDLLRKAFKKAVRKSELLRSGGCGHLGPLGGVTDPRRDHRCGERRHSRCSVGETCGPPSGPRNSGSRYRETGPQPSTPGVLARTAPTPCVASSAVRALAVQQARQVQHSLLAYWQRRGV